MPVLKVSHNGLTMGRAPRKNDHQRAKRGEVTGWSASAARRNLAFLRSVEADSLTGYGYTLTLTLKNCPETAKEWAKLRDNLIKRFARMGMIRGHWVTEWQKRGVPHLHGMFYFQSPGLQSAIVNAWLELAAEFVVSAKAQNVKEVTNVVGWFKYLAKHASRGHKHYQRAGDNIPAGWASTGRVWGYVGEWPIEPITRFEVDDAAFFRLRRIARGLELAYVREKHPVIIVNEQGGRMVFPGLKLPKDKKAISRARRRLKNNDREYSRLRGISEWLPKEQSDKVIMWMRANGYLVRQEGTEVLVTPDREFVFDPLTGEILM